jgi:hypothetical protein
VLRLESNWALDLALGDGQGGVVCAGVGQARGARLAILAHISPAGRSEAVQEGCKRYRPATHGRRSHICLNRGHQHSQSLLSIATSLALTATWQVRHHYEVLYKTYYGI